MGPSSGENQEESGPLIPWRHFAYNAESVEDVVRAALEAGYTVGFREEGKLIDITPTDGHNPTNRERREVNEFAKRIRAAQAMAGASAKP